VGKRDRYALHPNAKEAVIGVYASTDHVNRACRLFAPLSQHVPSNNHKSFCRATFCGSLRETDPQKVGRAFVEVLTNAVCYAAKWLKSSFTEFSEVRLKRQIKEVELPAEVGAQKVVETLVVGSEEPL
jgi:hypothetical protein